jgi:hypothetical protein
MRLVVMIPGEEGFKLLIQPHSSQSSDFARTLAGVGLNESYSQVGYLENTTSLFSLF